MAAKLDSVLTSLLSAAKGISDINFTPGQPPQIESHGRLICAVKDAERGRLTPEITQQIADGILRDNLAARETLDREGACDCSYALADGARFRVNVFRAQGALSVVLRVLPGEIPTLAGLGLPSVLGEVPKLNNGLVLVTGATGSGKSTTLAAMVGEINATRRVHIITLEDPVEFRHGHRLGTVNQRERGADFATFADGMRAALRQAPKVILVGELRDQETMEIALKAAETGHLVLSTLHTIDAGQTISRIVGMFTSHEQPLVRSRLAHVLRFVVAQRLMPATTGGRVAALEVMGTSMRVRELVQGGETEDKTFYNVIADGRPFGWQTFDQHISELYSEDVISAETANSYSSDQSIMRREIDRVRTSRGEDTSDLGEPQLAKRR